MGKKGSSDRFYFLGLQYHCRQQLQPWNSKTPAPWKKSYDKPRQHTKKERHYFGNKDPPSQSYGFPNSHVWMQELDCEESWVPKNWCFSTVVLEKTLESPLDLKEIQPVNPKEINPGISLEGMMLKLKLQYFGHLTRRADSLEDSDARRDWGQEEKGTTEDEMAGWHHWLDGREFGWTPGVDDGEGGLACCDSWGRKESDTTERLNWTELRQMFQQMLLESSSLTIR